MRSECPDDVLERWRGAIAAIISHYLDHWYRDRAIERYKDTKIDTEQSYNLSRFAPDWSPSSWPSLETRELGPTAHAQAGPGYRHRTRAQREFVLREREGGGSGRAARGGAAVRQAVTLHEAATLVECGRGHSRDLLKVNRAPFGSARRPAHTHFPAADSASRDLLVQVRPPRRHTLYDTFPRTSCQVLPAPARLFLYRVTSDFLVHA